VSSQFEAAAIAANATTTAVLALPSVLGQCSKRRDIEGARVRSPNHVVGLPDEPLANYEHLVLCGSE
jgi:hypothetical protein